MQNVFFEVSGLRLQSNLFPPTPPIFCRLAVLQQLHGLLSAEVQYAGVTLSWGHPVSSGDTPAVGSALHTQKPSWHQCTSAEIRSCENQSCITEG